MKSSDGLSSELRILGKTFTVRPFHEGLLNITAAGINDVKQCVIEYDPAQKLDQVKDTLLHEITHVLDYDFQLELTERQVHCIATGVMSVLKDNPNFAKWLIK